jgi:sigma-B regulation protein RsbU (phosphoserine phosphatase)
MRPHRLNLRSRLSLAILAGVGIIAGIVVVLTIQESRQALLNAKRGELFSLTHARAAQLEVDLEKVAQTVRTLAQTCSSLHGRLPQDELLTLMRKILQNQSHIYGLGAAYEPYGFDPNRKWFSPYLSRRPQGLLEQWLAPPEYNYPRHDWYLEPLLQGRPTWVEPYFGQAGQILMTSYSAPIEVQGQIKGAVVADVALDALGRQVAWLSPGGDGYAFVLSRHGTFLAAPRAEWIMRESIFSIAEGLDRPDIRKLGRRMIRDGQGLARVEDWLEARTAWLAFTPVGHTGLTFGALLPEAAAVEPIWDLVRKQIAVSLIGLVFLIALVWLLAVGLTRPLTRLASAAGRLARGDLSTRVEGVRPGDEVGRVAESFNQMVEDLNHYINELTTTTAAKERIASELDLARSIQQSILPRTYPAYPEFPELDLFGRTIPAREVGGDFYDYFMIDSHHLGVVLGDVSGKGVPSALFMTVARTLIKNSGLHYMDPEKVISEANLQIVPENEMCMFVTIFYGVYDISTGELKYVCAGHPAPLLRRATGDVRELEQPKGRAMGISEDLNLQVCSIRLEMDDLLLVFSDGLDEAVNEDQEMFGIERAATWLAGRTPGKAPQIIEDLIARQKEFTGPIEQFDDLTLLILRRQG